MKNRLLALLLAGLSTQLLGTAPSLRADLSSGMVAYYPFSGNAHDASGNGNDGALGTGLTLTQDRFGHSNSAYYFHGSNDDYVLVADSASLHLTNVSVSLWVCPGTQGANAHMVCKDYWNGGSCLEFTISATNVPTFGLWEVGVASPAAIPTNEWHHLVGTYDGAILKLFVDGQLTNATPYSGGLSTDNGMPLVLGQKNYLPKPGGWDWPYTGALDDIRIYNRALTESEVQQLYHLPGAPLQLTPLGQGQWMAPHPPNVLALCPVSNRVYLVNAPPGLPTTSPLHVIDVQDPEHPVRVGGGNTTFPVADMLAMMIGSAIRVAGDYAYVGAHDSMQVFNISNPTNCIFVSSNPLPLAVNGWLAGSRLTLASNFAYVAAGQADLAIFDIRDPTNCVLAGRYPTNADCSAGCWGSYDVAVANGYVYVVGGPGGLQIIDASDPSNCVLVGSCITGGDARGIVVAGNFAYLADGPAGLTVVDVSNPTNCAVVGTCAIPYARKVVVKDNYAFVACSGGLQVIDVSHPTNCFVAGNWQCPGGSSDVFVSEDHLIYLAAYPGLVVLPSVPNVQFALRVDGDPGTQTTIEASTGLGIPAAWSPIFTNNGPAMPFRFVDFDVKSPEKAQKFYRARQP